MLSNTLECRNGKVTGKVIPPVIDGSMKLKTLVAEATRSDHVIETMAVGMVPMIFQCYGFWDWGGSSCQIQSEAERIIV